MGREEMALELPAITSSSPSQNFSQEEDMVTPGDFRTRTKHERACLDRGIDPKSFYILKRYHGRDMILEHDLRRALWQALAMTSKCAKCGQKFFTLTEHDRALCLDCEEETLLEQADYRDDLQQQEELRHG
jgi:DNA-directed RNA polymerase subunit RPC12/RpoP